MREIEDVTKTHPSKCESVRVYVAKCVCIRVYKQA